MLNIKPTEAKADQFTATEFDTAENKARFLNMLTKFIVDGFPEDRYKRSKILYHHLHQHMGHVAHYNRDGFWDAQFSTPGRRLWFIEIHCNQSIACVGDPKYTWCDVGKAFRSWLNRNDVLNLLRQEYGVKAPVVAELEVVIVAMSDNIGSFGHNEFIVVDREGNGWKIQHIQSNGRWAVGDVLKTPTRDGAPTWAGLSVEIPTKIATKAPEQAVREAWSEADAKMAALSQ